MEIQENLDELRKKSAAYERGGSLQAIEKILLQKVLLHILSLAIIGKINQGRSRKAR